MLFFFISLRHEKEHQIFINNRAIQAGTMTKSIFRKKRAAN
jgi:hypothetical protein